MTTPYMVVHRFLPGGPDGKCGASLPGARKCSELENNAMHASELSVPHQRQPEGKDTLWETFSFFQECGDLVSRKNEQYGDAWRKQGYMGNLARIMSKTARLENMLWRDEVPDLPAEVASPTEKEQEAIADTLQDMANLCAFMAANLREGNKWGSR